MLLFDVNSYQGIVVHPDTEYKYEFFLHTNMHVHMISMQPCTYIFIYKFYLQCYHDIRSRIWEY